MLGCHIVVNLVTDIVTKLKQLRPGICAGCFYSLVNRGKRKWWQQTI